MLTLQRKPGEIVGLFTMDGELFGAIKVVKIEGKEAFFAFAAPDDVIIQRLELMADGDKKKAEAMTSPERKRRPKPATGLEYYRRRDKRR